MKSQKTALKICGLTDGQTLTLCVEEAVDYVGFNLVKTSPRYCSPDKIERIWKSFASGGSHHSSLPKAVLIVRDEPIENLREITRQLPFAGIIQLHGSEGLDYVREVRTKCTESVTIWKAICVQTKQQIIEARAYAELVDLILFDGPSPGSGRGFSWDLLRALELEFPYGLAGGVNAQNLAAALDQGACLVDIGSGVESETGVKDPDRIRELLRIFNASASSLG